MSARGRAAGRAGRRGSRKTQVPSRFQVTIFKDYTQENCLLECRAKLLLRRCRCLPYYYPRLDLILREWEEFAFLKNSTTCDWEGWQCLANSTGDMSNIYVKDLSNLSASHNQNCWTPSTRPTSPRRTTRTCCCRAARRAPARQPAPAPGVKFNALQNTH